MDKVFKRALIVIGAVALIPTLYFIVRIIVDLSTATYLPPVWDVLNWVAIGFYGLSLLMLVGFILYNLILEKHNERKEANKELEKETLKKYQSKRIEK